MKFKIGDRVRIRECGGYGFTEEMQKLCGEEFVITTYYPYHIYPYKGWVWAEDWLELVCEGSVEEEFDIDSTALESILKVL